MAKGYPTSLKHYIDKQEPLKFRKDGTFRILHLTDIHLVDPEMDDDPNTIQESRDEAQETINVMRQCIEQADPDLVVFGGDNISGFWKEFTYEYMVKSIKKLIEPVAEKNIPLAIVFGNHDSECQNILPFLRRENHVNIYAEYPNFRGMYNEEDVTGCCNYSLQILSHDESKVSWNIWCIDSNDYERTEDYEIIEDGGYGRVHEDQNNWYRTKSAQLKEQNGGVAVPSILFQHIPVKQEYDLLEITETKEENSIEYGDKFLTPKKDAFLSGVMREAPCPPAKDNTQFEVWKETGDIVAAFFGHDHVNTFIAEIDGIKLIQTVGAGYMTYGKERGGRLIVLKENSKEFDTEILKTTKMVLKEED